LSLSLAPPALYSIRHTHVTEEIRRTISIKEAEISNAIASTDVQLGVEKNLGEVCLAEARHEQYQVEEDVRNTVQQLEGERAALGCSRRLLETLPLKAWEDAIAEAIRGCRNTMEYLLDMNCI